MQFTGGIDARRIDNALKELSKVSKYLNLIIKKDKFYFGERSLFLRVIKEKINFDGYNFSDIELFEIPLHDDLMDVYFFSSVNKEYLLFKFNHSYVDGKGALNIIKELINIINHGMLEKELRFDSDAEYVKKLKFRNENRNFK